MTTWEEEEAREEKRKEVIKVVMVYFSCKNCGKTIQTLDMNCEYDSNRTLICLCGYMHIINLTIDSVPSEEEPQDEGKKIGSDGTYIIGVNELSTENLQDFMDMSDEEEQGEEDE
jgi:hypothetical protein